VVRDDRFFAITVANANGPRSSIRRFTLQKRWIKYITIFCLFIGLILGLGFYGLFQQANHLRIEHNNSKLREENQKLQLQQQELHKRIEAIEKQSETLEQMSGLNIPDSVPGSSLVSNEGNGAGGPSFPISSMEAADALVARTTEMELKLKALEVNIKEQVKIPSVWPVSGGLLNDNFGGRRSPTGGGYEFHAGQDIKVDIGTPVVTAAAGTVILAGYQSGYGYMVEIDHGNGLTTRYGHLSKINVGVGQVVKRGELIAESGNSGRSTGPHLHYEVRINNEPVNPALYLPNYDKVPRKE